MIKTPNGYLFDDDKPQRIDEEIYALYFDLAPRFLYPVSDVSGNVTGTLPYRPRGPKQVEDKTDERKADDDAL